MKISLKNESIIRFGFLVFLAFFASIPIANASNGLRVIGFGPDALGIGGAGVAYDRTSYSILSNPAGMNDAGNRADFNFTVAFPDTFMGTSGALAGNPDAVRAEGTDDPAFIPGAAVVWRASSKISLGVATMPTAGFQVEFPVSRFNSAITGNQYDRSGRYGNIKIAPGASYKIRDNLSVGVALDINYAFFHTDSAIIAPGFPETSGHSRFDSAMGIGGRVGVLYKPFKWMQGGALYQTRQHFQRFERYHDLIDTGLDLPQEVNAGLAFFPIDGLTVMGDFRWINWDSGFLGRNLAQGGLDWRDQYVFAGGVAYDFEPKLAIPATIRVGFNHGRNPIRSRAAFQNALTPLVIEDHLTAGFSFEVNEHIGMDGAYIREFESHVTQGADGSPTGRNAFVGATAHAFSIGLHAQWGGSKSRKE